LASLSLVVETLKDGAIEDPPAARRFLEHMENELGSLTQMVEELLELSRIESGKVPLSFKPTPVKKLVHKPVKSLRPLAERQGLTLTVNLADDLPRVHADTKRIHQVVMNLVHNAIKFTPPGGVITVFVKQEEGASELTIAVTDTGAGIPEDDVKRIFERFYKTDRARAQDGTGLGLAIAKHIVQGHGGRIWVESIEGVGSTFYFTLQVASL
jgi:two-component system phosphate regulon sensor histidine kinase PhoR